MAVKRLVPVLMVFLSTVVKPLGADFEEPVAPAPGLSPSGFQTNLCQVKKGDRVRKGPTWKWEKEDSEGCVYDCNVDSTCPGTLKEVTEISCESYKDGTPPERPEGHSAEQEEGEISVEFCLWIQVEWDCGSPPKYYRQGGSKCDVVRSWMY